MLSDRYEPVVVFFTYFFLLFGALWNATGWFSGLMYYTTSPMMLILGLLTLLSVEKKFFVKISLWFIVTAFVTVALEWVGQETGKVFGSYAYSDFLFPQVFNVPIVIGISWAGVCLGAIGLLQRSRKILPHSTSTKMLLTGLLMAGFDLLLEPVAIKLSYWSWSGNFPPLQNFLAWAIIGSIFSLPVYLIMKNVRLTKLAFHTFLAQVIYFIIIIIAKP